MPTKCRYLFWRGTQSSHSVWPLKVPHHDLEIMSTSIKQRLWSHSWDPVFASSPFKHYRRPPKSLNQGLHTTRCPFPQSRSTFKSDGPPNQAFHGNSVQLGISVLETTSSAPIFGAAQRNNYRYGACLPRPGNIVFWVRHAWARKLHSGTWGRDSGYLKRHKSSTSQSANSQTSSKDDRLPPSSAKKKRLKLSPILHHRQENTSIFRICPRCRIDRLRKNYSLLRPDFGRGWRFVSNGFLYEAFGPGI